MPPKRKRTAGATAASVERRGNGSSGDGAADATDDNGGVDVEAGLSKRTRVSSAFPVADAGETRAAAATAAAAAGDDGGGSGVDTAILEIVRTHGDRSGAVPQSTLMQRVRESYGASPAAPSSQIIVHCLNALLSAGELELLEAGGASSSSSSRRREAMFRIANDKKRLRGLSNTERAVYDQVRRASDSGLWVRHIRARLHITLPEVTKALKELERRDLIKSVHSIKYKTRKLYMLKELQPSREVTGGPFYGDDGFDFAFVDGVRKLIKRRLDAFPWSTVHELTAFLNRTEAVTVRLEPEDVERVAETMCWDFVLEKVTTLSPRMDAMRREAKRVQRAPLEDHRPHKYYVCLGTPEWNPDAVPPARVQGAPNGLSNVPCAVCPVADKCSPLNPVVNVDKCKYMERWTSSMLSY